MTPLFKKLNLKPEHGAITVLDAPAGFQSELDALTAQGVVVRGAAQSPLRFGLAFAVTQQQLDAAIARLVAAAQGDALLWFAYPKQSSKRYRCEFNRDSGWDAMQAAGYETVRMVAIDADWSALRWRQTVHVGR